MLHIRDELTARIETIVRPLIGTPNHICIIDPPGHANVGDSAIFLGELDFLRRCYPKARLSFYDFRSYSDGADRYIDQADVLLIHGGGNFGDIWLHHHRMRNHTLERFRHKKIIQMPQSISFSSPEELAITAGLIEKHPDFTVLTRDANSLKFAKEHFQCPSILCPDMAFAMNKITRLPPRADAFCLLRTDKEVVADHDAIRAQLAEAGYRVEAMDWLKEHGGRATTIDRRALDLTRQRPWLMAPLRTYLLGVRETYARERLTYGIDLLSIGKIVVTDRLHAHILAILLDIPNVVFDTWDGKVSALHNTWLRDKTVSRFVGGPADLRDAAREMMAAYERC